MPDSPAPRFSLSSLFNRRSAGLGLFLAAALLAWIFFPRFSTYWSHPVWTAAAIAVAVALVTVPRLSAIPARLGALVMRPSRRTFGLAVFLIGAAWFSALSWILYEGTPVLDDDVSALFQARIFLSGRLTVPAPAPAEFFSQFAIISGTHGVDWLCSMYPFGHPLVLLPGVAVGASWLIMPLFAAGACVMAAALGRALFSERTARFAALACLASPMFAELGSTHLNHAPTAFGVLLAAWSVLACLGLRRDAPPPAGPRALLHGLLAGVGISLAFLCRPADAAASGLVIGLLVLARFRRAWDARRSLLAAAAVLACAVVAHLAWTQIQTGDWRVPGHEFCMMNGMGRYGFTPFFGPRKAFFHAHLRTMELGAKATGWPVAVFFPALLPLFSPSRRKRALWLWAFPAALSALYFFFFWYEHCYPARYLFVAVPPLLILAAEGVAIFARFVRKPFRTVAAPPVFLALAVFLPFHLASFDDHWHDVERLLPKILRAAGVHDAVVIRHDRGHADDRADRVRDYYATSFLLNDVDFAGDVVHVRNLRGRNAELPALFPGRAIYLYRYNRSRNEGELYLERFDPATGAPSHTFIPLDLPGYADPDVHPLTIPDAAIARPRNPVFS